VQHDSTDTVVRATHVAMATNFGTQFTKLCKAGRHESIYKLYSQKKPTTMLNRHIFYFCCINFL